MKSFISFTIIIAIIFGLAFIPLTKGHTVWIQNKIAVSGTPTRVAATKEILKGNFNWVADPDHKVIDQRGALSHEGYSLNVPDNISSFWLVFGVPLSWRGDKWRGSFNNTGDICWHFHGSKVDWDVYPCP